MRPISLDMDGHKVGMLWGWLVSISRCEGQVEGRLAGILSLQAVQEGLAEASRALNVILSVSQDDAVGFLHERGPHWARFEVASFHAACLGLHLLISPLQTELESSTGATYLHVRCLAS